MLIIHHLERSQSERVIWLCEELALPYDLVRHKRDVNTGLAPPALKALHRYGTAPVIQDGELVLGESGAIMEYIINRYGQGRLAVAPDAANYADYLYWWHFANASLMPVALMDMLIQTVGGGEHPQMKPRRHRLPTAYSMIEERLGQAPYLAGQEFTAADIIMFFPLTTLRHLTRKNFSGSPNTLTWLQRVGSRPAYLRAMAMGDPGFEPLTGAEA